MAELSRPSSTSAVTFKTPRPWSSNPQPSTATQNASIPRRNNTVTAPEPPIEDLLYNRDLPFEVRELNETTVSNTMLNMKIYATGAQPGHDAESYRFELTHPDDLFFHYLCIITPNSYRSLQNKQNLTTEYAHLVDVATQIADQSVREPDTFSAVFKHKLDNQAKLAFFQNLGYKYIELLVLDFQASSDLQVRQHVTQSYRQLKNDYQLAKGRLLDVLSVVKSKNPSLLLYLQQSQKDSTIVPGEGPITAQVTPWQATSMYSTVSRSKK